MTCSRHSSTDDAFMSQRPRVTHHPRHSGTHGMIRVTAPTCVPVSHVQGTCPPLRTSVDFASFRETPATSLSPASLQMLVSATQGLGPGCAPPRGRPDVAWLPASAEPGGGCFCCLGFVLSY